MTLVEPEMCKECTLSLRWKEDNKKTDIERFVELFDSVGVKYELDKTSNNLDYITLITDYGSKIFLFSKTGKFSYEDFWPSI